MNEIICFQIHLTIQLLLQYCGFQDFHNLHVLHIIVNGMLKVLDTSQKHVCIAIFGKAEDLACVSAQIREVWRRWLKVLALFLNELVAATCRWFALKALNLKINHFQVFSEALSPTICNFFFSFLLITEFNVSCRYGGVFHVEKNGRYSLTRSEAVELCRALNSTLSTLEQLKKAHELGFETCR